MLTQDTTAFVEKIEVAEADKRADKRRRLAMNAELEVLQTTLELRVIEETLKTMERAIVEVGDSAPMRPRRRLWARGDDSITARDVEVVRTRLRRKREKLSAAKARARTLDLEARRSVPRRTVRSYRLHSALHHVDCSEGRFARWSDAQQSRPVWVTTTEGMRWWWYLGRFWWDDQRLRADEICALVNDLDRESAQQQIAIDRVRADVFGRRTSRRTP